VRHQIVRNGERGRACSDAGDALAVLRSRDARKTVRDIAAMIGRDALQAANGDRLLSPRVVR
jgi:hypothetical protein